MIDKFSQGLITSMCNREITVGHVYVYIYIYIYIILYIYITYIYIYYYI